VTTPAPVQEIRTGARLVGLVGTPRQIRARLRALDASPFDDGEADRLERDERTDPSRRAHILVRECVQPSLFGGAP
jgi:hypothetical protein